MIAWESQFSPKQMQEVSSYILTLVGTNPPNAKDPQGELYVPEEAPDASEGDMPTDSSTTSAADTVMTE